MKKLIGLAILMFTLSSNLVFGSAPKVFEESVWDAGLPCTDIVSGLTEDQRRPYGPPSSSEDSEEQTEKGINIATPVFNKEFVFPEAEKSTLDPSCHSVTVTLSLCKEAAEAVGNAVAGGSVGSLSHWAKYSKLMGIVLSKNVLSIEHLYALNYMVFLSQRSDLEKDHMDEEDKAMLGVYTEHRFPSLIARTFRGKKISLLRDKLQYLSPQIAAYTQLEELDLSENQLTFLPMTFEHLINLRTLVLDKNSLVSLPDCLEFLQDLTRLSVKNNPLDEDSKAMLRHLRELGVDVEY